MGQECCGMRQYLPSSIHLKENFFRNSSKRQSQLKNRSSKFSNIEELDSKENKSNEKNSQYPFTKIFSENIIDSPLCTNNQLDNENNEKHQYQNFVQQIIEPQDKIEQNNNIIDEKQQDQQDSIENNINCDYNIDMISFSNQFDTVNQNESIIEYRLKNKIAPGKLNIKFLKVLQSKILSKQQKNSETHIQQNIYERPQLPNRQRPRSKQIQYDFDE